MRIDSLRRSHSLWRRRGRRERSLPVRILVRRLLRGGLVRMHLLRDGGDDSVDFGFVRLGRFDHYKLSPHLFENVLFRWEKTSFHGRLDWIGSDLVDAA